MPEENKTIVDDLDINLNSLPYDMSTILGTLTGATGPQGSSSSYGYGTITINTSPGANGTSGSYLTSNAYTTSWANVSNNGNGLHVTSDAEFDGDIKWKGRSLGKLLESIEDRLAILTDPDPKKLEKFAALKKAYDNYKLMEKLIGED